MIRAALVVCALLAAPARAEELPEVVLQADLARLQSATLALHERAGWVREHSRVQLVVATLALDEARAKRGDTPRFAADKERWSECWKNSAPLLEAGKLSGPLLKHAELAAARARGAGRGASPEVQALLEREERQAATELWRALERRLLEVEVWRTAGERVAGDATVARGVRTAEAFLDAARAALEHLRSVGAEPAPEAPAQPDLPGGGERR